LKTIRRRITSVKSTGKITRAMKLVATAKLRRAQERLLQMRPYAVRIGDMIAELAQGTDAEAHALLAVRPPKRTLLLVLTSDRGLAGAFNSNVNKTAWRWVAEHKDQREHIELRIVGKKGRDFFKNRPVNVGHVYTDVLNNVTLERSTAIGRELTAAYVDGEFDEVYVVYNEFKSAIAQRPVSQRLLPIRPEEHDIEPDAAPVPTPDTSISTLPSVSFQISSAVVCAWICGLAGFWNCCRKVRARWQPDSLCSRSATPPAWKSRWRCCPRTQ
jgi:F-type H+-transporting ATPase subunit gamma